MKDVLLDFSYNHPIMTQLASFVHRVLSGQAVDMDAEGVARMVQMAAILTKYASTFPKPSWCRSVSTDGDSFGEGPPQQIMLIRRNAGCLGPHLLSQVFE